MLALPHLLGICLPSLWGPLFPLHALALIPLSPAKVRLSLTFTFSPLRSGTLDRRLCSFSFRQGRLRRSCQLLSLCGAEVTLSFSAGPVCSSFSAEACAIAHALCWSRQHQQVFHFSLFSYLTLVLSLPPCPSFLLSQTLLQIWQELSSLSSCSIRLQWVPGHSFLPGNDAADELARRGALLAPSAILSSLSRLVSRIHSSLFSDRRRTVSSKFFDTHVPSISTKELVLPRHACCVRSRPRCNGHSLLLSSYLSGIGSIENSSCSACGHSSQDISHLILHCPATDSLRRSLFGDSLFLRPLVQAPGSCPASGAPWSSAMPPSLGRIWVINNKLSFFKIFLSPAICTELRDKIDLKRPGLIV